MQTTRWLVGEAAKKPYDVGLGHLEGGSVALGAVCTLFAHLYTTMQPPERTPALLAPTASVCREQAWTFQPAGGPCPAAQHRGAVTRCSVSTVEARVCVCAPEKARTATCARVCVGVHVCAHTARACVHACQHTPMQACTGTRGRVHTQACVCVCVCVHSPTEVCVCASVCVHPGVCECPCVCSQGLCLGDMCWEV